MTEIITSEKLKPEETRKFVANAFRDGALKTTGTEIDKLMPPVSRFGGGSRAKKKQGIIEKLKVFFEKYFEMCIRDRHRLVIGILENVINHKELLDAITVLGWNEERGEDK